MFFIFPLVFSFCIFSSLYTPVCSCAFFFSSIQSLIKKKKKRKKEFVLKTRCFLITYFNCFYLFSKGCFKGNCIDMENDFPFEVGNESRVRFEKDGVVSNPYLRFSLPYLPFLIQRRHR